MIPNPLLAGILFFGSVFASPLSDQRPLGHEALSSSADADTANSAGSQRGLSGRFLHITDLHPDRLYKDGASTSERVSCHRGEGRAGYLGAEGTECDAPLALIDETFRWIENNLKGEIDFVIWTGDSARHDNDWKNPRTPDEVISLNKFIADKFLDTFKHPEAPRTLSIPVIPTLGNNDIMPHNILVDGPNEWTKRYLNVWTRFIPEHQRHSFVEGGWFTSEVIPNQLAVISLNTMYFFDSNSAVDGCADKSEPGYEHMEWLRVQLKILRSRGMKAILIGHVPPARTSSKQNWDESCWQKYTLWVHQYRDVIVGSAYGHMNLDHFMFQDSRKIDIVDDFGASSSEVPSEELSDRVGVQSRSDYLSSLRKDWSRMPSPPNDLSLMEDLMDDSPPGGEILSQGSKKKRKKFFKKIGGPWAERYSVSLVSPSLVPNYFPTLRVVEYNITGLEGVATWVENSSNLSHEVRSHETDDSADDDSADEGTPEKNGKKKKKKPNFKVPEPPSPSAPPGPAYSNQPLTWLSYTQYFANLTRIYDEMAEFKSSTNTTNQAMEESDETIMKNLFSFEVEYDTKDRIYKMDDLTVRSFFKLATRAADNFAASSEGAGDDDDDDTVTKKNRVWRAFLERAFVKYMSYDELYDIE
ncbi:Endopolyphosphatase [Aspergillus campestris IBT 28561]|uniref:Endopolyphosphatase n=1 Tax=Aspergillus campestris (strain IBT 28561) TaxID=1392248 RepID=A0A2I1DFR0_ASPC2|nr:Endopolyphosphatase [Aspergillus campestris IBT 28561]PKY08709.1 Endopolyphosphatase [Aspergillus campestris IBT 28561]